MAHQNIEITVSGSFTAYDGAKNTRVGRIVALYNPANFFPM